MPENISLGPIDIGIIIVYLAAIVLMGYIVGRGKEDTEGYFLAGRKLTWPLIGLSLYASNMSGSSFVGLASGGYANGVVIYHYEWVTAVILIFFLFFILPFYLRSRVFTMPEFLERRFDRRSRYTFSALTLFLNMAVDTAGALYAGGVVIQIIFPGIPLWQSISALAVVAGIYTIFGGLSAVVLTDAIQAVILIIGATLVSIVAFLEVGSWQAVVNAAPEGGMHLFQPINDEVLPWPGLIGVILIGFYYWCTNQVIVQRALGARDVNQGRWGALFGGFLKIPAIFILIMPGIFAAALYPELDNPDNAFPLLAFGLMPVGLRGLIGAALIAAIMSSVDSTLNSASTLVTMDFVKTLRSNIDDRRLTIIGRTATGIFMLIAAIWAPQIQNFPSLWTYLQSILGYIVPPVVAAFILGIFWKRANAHGAFWTLISVGLLGITLFISIEVLRLFEFQFLYSTTLLFLLSCTMLVGISLATGKPAPEKVDELTWHRRYWHNETRELQQIPWYKNYRIQSAALAILALTVVIFFW
jgi:SSS family solute:Na+ symporter